MNTDLSAEFALLALMMTDEDARNYAVEAGVTPDWFARPANAVIFRLVVSLHERRAVPSDETVAVEVTRTPEFRDKLVAASDVHHAASFIGYGHNAEFLVAEIADTYRRRQLREMAHRILTAAADPSEPSADTAAAADEALLAITTTDTGQSPTDFASAVAAALDPSQFGQGITTGLADLDKATTGLHPGEYSIIGARPSMGKTALLTTMAHNMARAGISVGIFSLEMSRGALAQRIIASVAGVRVIDIRKGELSEAKLSKLHATATNISGLPIVIDDRAESRSSQMRATLRRWLRSPSPPQVIFVDYLQMVQPDTTSRSDNREREMSRVSASLKAMAKTYGVHVCALAQLSRKNEQRPDKRPVMSDLRDSGQIEQDADMILLLHRPEYYGGKTLSGIAPEGIAEVNVAKARNGVTGTVELFFDADMTTFRNLYRETPSLSQATTSHHELTEADSYSPF
jgi:replicative DNA helicase